MKAILIIDMPQNCVDCPCSFTFGSPPHNICEAMNDKSLTKENMSNTKPSWCPLKPMPSREDIHEEIYQAYGLGKEEPYNRMRDAVDKVLDEILGEDK